MLRRSIDDSITPIPTSILIQYSITPFPSIYSFNDSQIQLNGQSRINYIEMGTGNLMKLWRRFFVCLFVCFCFLGFFFKNVSLECSHSQSVIFKSLFQYISDIQGKKT